MQGYNQWETKESFVKELVPELSLEEGRVKEAVQRKAAHEGTAHTEKREREEEKSGREPGVQAAGGQREGAGRQSQGFSSLCCISLAKLTFFCGFHYLPVSEDSPIYTLGPDLAEDINWL